MTEEGQGVIVLKDNKKETINKEENKNEIKSKVDINNYDQEVLDSKENLETNPQKNEQLGFNKKNVYELSSETIEKLKISPCQICQSNNYSIFIPENVFNVSNKNENPQDQTIENENQIKKNLEEDYIKPIINENVFFPILICKKNHQTCLLCNKSPHINTLCDQNNIDYYNIISKLNTIKEIYPEKANIIECMKESASTLNKKNDDDQDCKQSRCYCCFIWFVKIISAFLLNYIWAVISLFLFNFALLLFAICVIISFFYTICHGLCIYCCGNGTSSEEIILCIGFGLGKSIIGLILPGFKKINSCIFEN